MKILHVTPAYLPAYRYGGPIQSVHALNKWLARAHAEVTVYTTPIDGPQDSNVPQSTAADLKLVNIDGVQVHYFKPGRFRSWFHSPDLGRALNEHAKDFDIIHITSVFLSVSTLGAKAAQKAGVPYVISPRGSLMAAPLQKKSPLKKRMYLRFLERGNLEHAAAIHFTTEPEKLEYEKLGYKLKKSIIIPNGLDPESLPPGDPEAFRQKFNIPKERKIILFLGRLSWKKGLDTLLPAFAEVAVKIPEAVLVLAGGDDENYMPTLENLIDAAGIRDKVVFTGAITGSERTAAYRNAEIFVLPSYSENFAGTVAEAMYFGVPVAVSEGVGLASVVRESGAGLVVPKDTNAFAAAILKILKNHTVSRSMGDRGISTATSQFRYDKVAEAFLKAYANIVEDIK